MHGARIFIDSNTFLYSLDASEPGKRQVAKDWIAAIADYGVTNLQVLNEVMNVLTRKSKRFGGGDNALFVDGFSQFGKSPIDWSTILKAREIHSSTGYSWWDSLLLASAMELGCTHFLSEDLQDGHRLGGLTIMDPFAHSPATIIKA